MMCIMGSSTIQKPPEKSLLIRSFNYHLPTASRRDIYYDGQAGTLAAVAFFRRLATRHP